MTSIPDAGAESLDPTIAGPIFSEATA
jgi:hypothetical protein